MNLEMSREDYERLEIQIAQGLLAASAETEEAVMKLLEFESAKGTAAALGPNKEDRDYNVGRAAGIADVQAVLMGAWKKARGGINRKERKEHKEGNSK